MEVPGYNTMVTELHLHYMSKNTMVHFQKTRYYHGAFLQRKDGIGNRLLMIGFG